jgi:molybdopterin molybdotransferase
VSRLFDSYLIVDWSARSTPSSRRPTSDAIWIGAAGAVADAPRYFRTRAAALDWLTAALVSERGEGRCVLVGFDFPFGYPRGFAAAMTGKASAMALWDHLAKMIEDGPDNANNRFAVAAALNARLPECRPFWGRPARLALPDLPDNAGERRMEAMPERRVVEEHVRAAQPVWKLYTAGSVGGQALVGLPALHRLRNDRRLAGDIAVWPFDTGLAPSEAPVTIAEIYPSLLAEEVERARAETEILDRAQVRVVAQAFATLDANGGLAPLFRAAPDLSPSESAAVVGEEGWILGAGHVPALKAAVKQTPPLRNDCFALPPGIDWVPVDEAVATLRARLSPVVEAETIPIEAAGGRVLAAPLFARRAHPPSANAAVDGYGFAHASLGDGPHDLPLVAGRAAAGAPLAAAVPSGSAVRILTGAVLPEGVDTVVLQEDVVLGDGRVRFARGLKRGANTRSAGEDVAAGDALFARGHILQPHDLALAAATGLSEVLAHRPLRVAVLSTGDELAAPGTEASSDRTYDANRPMLLDLLRRWGMEPVDLGMIPDRRARVEAALARGAAGADAILASGGASAGDEDHVSASLRARDALTTWRIAIKPGRPLALGLWDGVPVFGLPGNPVAAFVCALIFARPALLQLAGAGWREPQGYTLPAAFPKDKRPGRREYLRARRNGNGAVEVFASEGSGRISGLAWAEGLVELGDGAAIIRPGDPVRFLPYTAFGL